MLDGVTVSDRRDPDLVTLFSRAGKSVAKFFTSKRAKIPTSVLEPTPGEITFSFGIVYANKIAAAEIDKPTPRFPPGSILVRERFDSLTTTVPSAVIAMIKRPPGFSIETDDWEFVAVTGSDLKIVSQQKAGSCSQCHSSARSTDWVFLSRFKN